MSKHDRVLCLVQTLENCRAELDRIEAFVAAAHLDAALNALRRHTASTVEVSKVE